MAEQVSDELRGIGRTGLRFSIYREHGPERPGLFVKFEWAEM